MADAPVFQSPITDPTPTKGSLTLADESALTKVSVRGADMGVPFGASEQRGDVLVVGSRPDEWTLLGDVDAVAAVVAGLDLSGFASTTDITHTRLCVRLTGTDTTKALEKVCGIDLSDAMTPNGAAFGASVAKVTCDVVRDDIDGVPSYRFLTDRSFGQYFWDVLRDCAAEF